MSNLSMFFQGKKNFITTNDFKHFLNEEILINAKEEPYFHEPSSIIELAKSPIRNLNNEVLENVYILKYIFNHTNVSDFLCIVDNTNKVIILNEKILLREINYETLNIDDKLFNIARKLRYKPIIDIDYVTITSEEIDCLNQ
ncbi:MAG: hypothetical protein IJH34_01950, partial [Romboutsia sp.]|nr:hypothetical protein [Romboutsia sp.]